MEFETITMKEDESFNTFHSKLKDIVNSLYNLGDIISESCVVIFFYGLYLIGLSQKLLSLKKVRI